MKIIVIGAGAMGCLYGAYLSKEHEVIMIDSYKGQVDQINEYGIQLEELDGQLHTYKNVTAYESGMCEHMADVIIVFVKSTYTNDALAQNKHLFDENTIVMTLQNGAGNDRKIAQYVAKENIIIGTSKHSALHTGNGIIQHRGEGLTTIGSNHHQDERLQMLSSTLQKAGFEMEVSQDIQRIIWSKLFVNLSINTFTAITETPIGYMVENDYAWNFAKRLIYEAVDVAEEDGTYFDRREVLDMVKHVCHDAKQGYSSMYQDRKKGILTEIDAINGAIVEQAKQYGVPVPYNTLIVDLIHAIEGTYEFNKKQEIKIER